MPSSARLYEWVPNEKKKKITTQKTITDKKMEQLSIAKKIGGSIWLGSKVLVYLRIRAKEQSMMYIITEYSS